MTGATVETATSDPESIYTSLAEAYDQVFIARSSEEQRLSNLRLLAGALLLASIVWFILQLPVAALVAALVSGVVFVWLVVRHRHAANARLRAQILRDINLDALARISRDWDNLSESDLPVVPADHPFAADLDIVGHASLFRLLNTTATATGSARLFDWLTDPARPPETQARQGAVQELAPLLAWRQHLQMLGTLNQSERRDPAAFLQWAESDPALPRHGWLPWLARIGAAATAIVALLALARIIPAPLIAVPLIANLMLGVWSGHVVGDRISIAREQHPALKSYGDILAHIDTQHFAAPLLGNLLDELGSGNKPAHEEVIRLGKITSFAVPRSAITHFALQALGNWDVHVLDALERWQRENGQHVRQWLEVIGTFEALAALAGLAHDNPEWVFADVGTDCSAFDGRELGHPLISETARVCNTVRIGPPGTFLLVTGSNMSGKSTLLRSIGINAVLALAGGPSCARSLTLPPVDLWTSVRVTDSLEAGISFYMAELLRLKAVHEAAVTAHREGRPFLYLLDEILQGTNSAERQIAARHIIARLVDLGAIGAVSTHDLHLADGPELEASAVPVHFSDVFTDGPDGPVMSFDYQLRPGVATSTNALNLMRIVGFEPARL
jgi:hypothetical protein